MSRTRLAVLRSLPSGERRLAVHALVALIVARAAVSMLSWAAVRALVARVTPVGPAAARLAAADAHLPGDAPGASADERVARAVRRAIDRAARTMPSAACLPQSVAAEVLLRRAGCAARLVVGVAPNGAPLAAHAWVESAGIVVTGLEDEAARHTAMLVYDDAHARAEGARA